MNARPLIGITARKIAFFHQDRPYRRYGVPIAYLDAVEESRQGRRVMIPPSSKPDVLLQTYSMLDGLLLPGGHDVRSRALRGRALSETRSDRPSARRDGTPSREEGVGRRSSFVRSVPRLSGAERGRGGSLHQDLATHFGKPVVRHFQQHVEEGPSHTIEIESGSRLEAIAGATRVRVDTYHHRR
jgi:putative glutamine amidotransferase